MRQPHARHLALLVLPAVLGLALGGCGRTVQDTFGLNRRAPDEFQVVRRAPLIVPPEARLRPPQPGAPGPVTTTPSDTAFTALTGAAPQPPRNLSPAEQLLVSQTPGEASPNIRQAIASEDSQVAVLDRNTFLFILGWQRQSAQDALAGRQVLDPVQESQRLRDAGTGVVETERTASTPILR